MHITKKVAMLSVAALLTGCAGVQQQSFKLSDGQVVDYIHGKVDADGQTGVFRDAFINGTPVLSHFGSGQSLTGQILQGAASSAMIAGGMVGAAAMLRPTRINETNNLTNDQDQKQGQLQGQQQGQHATSVAVSESSSKASNYNKNTSNNTAVNANTNHNTNTNHTKNGNGNNGHHNGHGDD